VRVPFYARGYQCGNILEDQIKRHVRESQKHNYTVFLVPRLSTLVSRVLEEEGVLGEVVLSTYNLQFIPVADDVISLEREDAFRELWVVSYVYYGLGLSTYRVTGWRRNSHL
jgi:hypothetical protein